MDRRIQDPSFLRDYWRGLTNQGKLIEVAMEERGPTGKVRKSIVVADTSQSRETITLWDVVRKRHRHCWTSLFVIHRGLVIGSPALLVQAKRRRKQLQDTSSQQNMAQLRSLAWSCCTRGRNF